MSNNLVAAFEDKVAKKTVSLLKKDWLFVAI